MYKLAFVKKNVFWDSEYRNLPAFIHALLSSSQAKIDVLKYEWIENNYLGLTISKNLKNSDSVFEINEELETNSSIKLDFANYQDFYSKEELLKTNYAIFYNINGEQIDYKYYFIEEINFSLTDNSFEVTYDEDFMFNELENIYKVLPTKIYLERAHLNRYVNKDSKKEFNWDKILDRTEDVAYINSLKQERTYSFKPDSELEAQINSGNVIKSAIVLFIKQEPDTSLNELNNLNFYKNMSLPYSLVFLPIDQVNNSSQEIANYQNYIELINYYQNKVIAARVINNVRINNKNNEASLELKEIKVASEKTLKIYLPLKAAKLSDFLITEQNLELEDNFYQEFSYQESRDFLFNEPKLYRWPITYGEISSTKNNVMFIDPAKVFSNDLNLAQTLNFKLSFNVEPKLTKYSFDLINLNSTNSLEEDKNIFFADLRLITEDHQSLPIDYSYNNFLTTSKLASDADWINDDPLNKDFILYKYELYLYTPNNSDYKADAEMAQVDSTSFYAKQNRDLKLMAGDFIENEFFGFDQKIAIPNKKSQVNQNKLDLAIKEKHQITIKQIDQNSMKFAAMYYFKYGYKVLNSIDKELAFAGRNNFNYLRIPNLKNDLRHIGRLDQDLINNINLTFSQGIRLWHQESLTKVNAMNYQEDNSERSLEEVN